MAIALFPGTFDPVTNGHLDLIQRASGHFDRLIVAVGTNIAKRPWFTTEQRVEMLNRSLPGSIEVVGFDGLLMDLAHDLGANCVVKGVRTVADIEFETVQATANRELGGLETFFLAASPQWSHVSSSLVRELAAWGGDYSRYIPATVSQTLTDFLASRKKGDGDA